MTPSRVKRARRNRGQTATFQIRGFNNPEQARIVDAPLTDDGNYVLVFEERTSQRRRWEVNFSDIVTPIRYGV